MNSAVKPVASRYGMLTVIGHERGLGWRVRCECGTERHFDGGALRTETYRSCGCIRYKRHASLLKERHAKAKAAKANGAKIARVNDGPCWCCRMPAQGKSEFRLCVNCGG